MSIENINRKRKLLKKQSKNYRTDKYITGKKSQNWLKGSQNTVEESFKIGKKKNLK